METDMTLCSDEEMAQLLAAMHAGTPDELGLAERLIEAYPDDARLHFLRGSMLAGSGRPIEAHAALSRAVALAPDFALARFQLGFFELTSGEAARALATWEPLDTLASDHYLAHFVRGLRHLIQDHFGEAIRELTEGIAVNEENPPLNRDMRLIIDECSRLAGDGAPAAPADAEASATSFLLDQIGRGTSH
jgi:tetratricopeptide (TPR) repeat protein